MAEPAAPSKRASAAERALERAIEEGTAAVQAELRVARTRITQLEGLLTRIASIATQPTIALPEIPRPSAPAIETLPEHLQEHLRNPPEPLPLDDQDSMGPGRWI